MKKTLLATVLFLTMAFSTHAQKYEELGKAKEQQPVRPYFGLATGINNISGFAGVTAEIPFSPNFSGKLGLGIGGWGLKIGVAAKYYKLFPESWAFGVGYSTASGVKNIDLNLTTNGSTQNIKMNLDRAHLMDFVASKAWGDKFKLNLDFGYAVRLSGGTYSAVDKTTIITSESRRILDILSPNGLILGLGIAFRL
jgi:hypothetical protein